MAYSELTFSDLAPTSFLRKGDKIIPSAQPVGQEVALRTLKWGLSLSSWPNAHFFCVGAKGVGRTTLTLKVLHEYAQAHQVEKDWVYVCDFSCPSVPLALPLAAGQGLVFAHQMRETMDKLRQKIKKLFRQKSYGEKLQEIEDFFQRKKETFLKNLESIFAKKGIALVQSGAGYGLCPLVQDKVCNADDFQALPPKVRQKILPELEAAKRELAAALGDLFAYENEKNTTLEQLNQMFVEEQTTVSLAPLKVAFQGQEQVQSYLDSVQTFLGHKATLLCEDPDTENVWGQVGVNPFLCFEKKEVPVLCPARVDIPTLLGNYALNFQTDIPPYKQPVAGLLHRANGGFLVLDADEILRQEDLFYVLKQVLFSHQISFQNSFGAGLPIHVRVVLIGSYRAYEELKSKDEDFSQLFKIVVPFVEQMPRTAAGEKAYVAELAFFAQENRLKKFSLSAYQALLNAASRRASFPKKEVSLHFAQVHDLMRSADYFARLAKATQVSACHVQQALLQCQENGTVSQKQWLENLTSGVLLLQVKGTQVGAVHILSLCETQNKKFGRMARLFCTTWAGNGTITDIEGQVDFGGPIHTKGLLILQGYLKSCFGQSEPLKLDASLGMEQSYGPIEGDSASCGELCALMSAIGGIPLSQSIAITGSVNALGQVGAVSGINEKIEGFFDACQALGRSANQGVIFPRNCVKELLLKPEVVQAVKEKKFHLYAVDFIDECMEILSGLNKQAVHKKISTAWHQAYLKAIK